MGLVGGVGRGADGSVPSWPGGCEDGADGAERSVHVLLYS